MEYKGKSKHGRGRANVKYKKQMNVSSCTRNLSSQLELSNAKLEKDQKEKKEHSFVTVDERLSYIRVAAEGLLH